MFERLDVTRFLMLIFPLSKFSGLILDRFNIRILSEPVIPVFLCFVQDFAYMFIMQFDVKLNSILISLHSPITKGPNTEIPNAHEHKTLNFQLQSLNNSNIPSLSSKR